MKELFEAIYNYWSSEGKFGLTELYLVEAPALSTEDGDGGSVFPYATYSTSIIPDWTFTEEQEDCLIMFALFSDTVSHIEICTIATTLKASFDFHDLVIDDYETISLERGNANLIRVEKIWQYSINYSLLVEKT